MHNAIINPNVELHEPYTLGSFVILGEPPRNRGLGDLPLFIGPDATIRSHTIIYAGNKIGNNFQSGHGVLIREENRIGDNVSIGSGTIVEHHVEIADRVRIHSQAFIPEFSILEEGVWIGPKVCITNARYPNAPNTKSNLQGVVIEKGAIIGAHVTLLPGIRIGRNALVGAGSVVTRDVETGTVVFGNPGVTRGRVEDIPSYRDNLISGPKI